MFHSMFLNMELPHFPERECKRVSGSREVKLITLLHSPKYSWLLYAYTLQVSF